MEKGEWIKHMPFLYLQMPDDENILSGTTECGEQLHVTTVLEEKGRRTKKEKKTNRKEQAKEEQQCH